MGLYDDPPTDAAMALDVLDLPVGTFVAWIEDRGYAGVLRQTGTVQKATEKSYILAGWLGGMGRVERTPDGVKRRRLRALRTPDEEKEFRRLALSRTEQDRRDRARAKADEARGRVLREVHQAALAELAERHPDEYAEAHARLLAEAQVGEPCHECGGVDYTDEQGRSACARCSGTGVEP